MRVHPGVTTVIAASLLGAAAWLGLGGQLGGPDGDASPDASVATSPAPSPSSTATPDPSAAGLATPAPAPTPTALPVPADRNQVILDLAMLLDDPEHDPRSDLGVVVLDESGRLMIERSPDQLLLPASTMKLVTAAATLAVHGADGRLATPVLVNGPISSHGTVAGDVIVLAGGDPSLATEEYRRFVYPARPASHTSDLIEVLRAAGVERVAGGLVVDPGPYADQRRPEGWRDVYLSDFDARYITGLTVDAGLDVVMHAPRRDWDELTQEQLDDGGIEVFLSRDPLVHAGDVLRREFDLAGMTIGRSQAVVGTRDVDSVRIGEILSPPVSDLLAFMAKQSDNHLADTLLREVGATVGGRSSWASSAQAALDVLGDLGVDMTGARVADGSGLSREDRLSARQLASIDQAMRASPLGEAWASIMSVAGEDGTLRRRLDNTIADGRFRGKTGTLSDVRALVGTVDGPGGHRYHLAVVGNGGEVWRATTLADQMILRLTRSLWCGTPGAPSDVVVACAA